MSIMGQTYTEIAIIKMKSFFFVSCSFHVVHFIIIITFIIEIKIHDHLIYQTPKLLVWLLARLSCKIKKVSFLLYHCMSFFWREGGRGEDVNLFLNLKQL